MGNIHSISNKTTELIDQIYNDISAAGYYIKTSGPSACSFIVSWADSPYMINVAYPPYINETAEISGYVIETSLGYGPNNTPIYIKEAGYKSAQYFTNAADLINEIKRISIVVSNPSFSCKEHSYIKPARPACSINANIQRNPEDEHEINYYEIKSPLIPSIPLITSIPSGPLEDKYSMYNIDITKIHDIKKYSDEYGLCILNTKITDESTRS